MKREELYGQTRTVVKFRHAVIAPDGHVPSVFPGWVDATGFVILSPRMGATLSQIAIVIDAENGRAIFPADEHEHVFYVESGSLTVNDGEVRLEAGGFYFSPPQKELVISGTKGARLTLFRKKYEAVKGLELPMACSGNVSEIRGEPFLGCEGAILKTLLPLDVAYDLAINVFTYDPGATLPFVETHIMEHGLLMLSGQGVYRLENEYYPVKAGDAIWMAPYCPQWFVAMGEEKASYLYYKDVNRLP